MARLADSYSAAHAVVLVDTGVVRDIAHALSGLWRPKDEPDPVRRDQLVAAGRLRLYGAAADRSGWHLVCTAAAHAHAEARGDADWSAGFLPALESYDDAPSMGDVEGLVGVLRRDDKLDGESAQTLALALLCEEVSLVITRDPRAFRHNREGDLPERLEILEPEEAVARLELGDGEPAWTPPTEGSMLETLGETYPWWVPGTEAPADLD